MLPCFDNYYDFVIWGAGWYLARLTLHVNDGHIRTIRYNELLSHGRLEDAEEMAEEILRFLGTPCEDDRSLLILHFIITIN